MKARGNVVLIAIVAGLVGLAVGTTQKKGGTDVPQVKYQTAVPVPPAPAMRELSRPLQAHMRRLFTESGKPAWVARGPGADQAVTTGKSAFVNDCAVADVFANCVLEVTFQAQVNIGPAPGATPSLSLRLDSKTELGDHAAQSLSFSGIGISTSGVISIRDLIPVSAGRHEISVLVAVASGGSGVTLPANTAILTVKQL